MYNVLIISIYYILLYSIVTFTESNDFTKFSARIMASRSSNDQNACEKKVAIVCTSERGP